MAASCLAEVLSSVRSLLCLRSASSTAFMTIDRNRDPIDQFKAWLADAERNEPNDPNAMSLATATPDGIPSARMVLLKGIEGGGFAYQPWQPQGFGTRGKFPGSALLSLEVAASAGSRRGSSRAGRRRRGRCLLCHTGQGQSDRRLGIKAIAAADRPLRARGACREVYGEVSLGRYPARTGRAIG